jgi:hypothetical protein
VSSQAALVGCHVDIQLQQYTFSVLASKIMGSNKEFCVMEVTIETF